MPLSKKIKICKVESKSFAKYCLLRGADFLGVHSLDFDLNGEKRSLCRYIAARGGRVVLLTKERDLEKIAQLVDFYKPRALQPHYALTPESYTALVEALHIPIVPVVTDETEAQSVSDLINMSEFIIYDTSYVGGTGIRHERKHLSSLSPQQLQKVFLAGGVTPELITQLSEMPVAGFDVQSFCRENGRHHYGKAKQLFDVAKGREERQLSVSLTDVEDLSDIPAYEDSASLEYQVDYSEGNLYEHFLADNEKMLQFVSQLDAPVTLHIFEKNLQAFQSIIDRFMAAGGNNIVRVNIQYSSGLAMDTLNVYNATLCASLYYKDIPAYFKQFSTPHACISLILPSELDRKVEALEVYKSEVVVEYILEDWGREHLLVEELRNG
jgi:phosphoribosylanthranilate isomerase